MEISAKCDTYLCQPDNHVQALSLSTVDKRACFLKTPASLQFSNLHFNILFSEKCNSSSVYLWEKEGERDAVYVLITTVTVKLWL